jgi:hypothetical protein
MQVQDLTVSGGNRDALPVLAGLQRADSLVIHSPVISDLASFSGLLCSRKIKVTANRLTSLGGLSQVQALDSASDGPVFELLSDISFQVPNITIEDLAALRLYAACPTNSGSPWTKKSLVLVNNICNGPVRPPLLFAYSKAAYASLLKMRFVLLLSSFLSFLLFFSPLLFLFVSYLHAPPAQHKDSKGYEWEQHAYCRIWHKAEWPRLSSRRASYQTGLDESLSICRHCTLFDELGAIIPLPGCLDFF